MVAAYPARRMEWASSPPVFVGCNVWDQYQDNRYLFLQFTHGPGKQLRAVDSNAADEDQS